jgi:glutamate synthase (NADPH/NADH) small chain
VLNINDDAVAIKQIERAIADRGWEEGWIVPTPPATRSHFRVAVIGSGPAGLAGAQQLARAGHQVTVFERDEQPGGLLRYGIPDFKLEKHWIDKRIAQMQREGVQFRTGVEVGVHISGTAIRDEFHAVCIATGAMKPRDLPIPGRQFAGVHFAMDYLAGQNRVVSGALAKPPLTAAGKRVIVLGGGDTGSDCVGTANRQGAESVTQIELLPRPPEAPTSDMLWPNWPMVLRTSTSHEEGVEREWSLLTERFTGDAGGNVTALQVSRLLWDTDAQGRRTFVRDPAGARELQAELVLLALGFEGCAQSALYRELGVELSAQGSVRGNGGTPSDGFATGAPGVYACGDARRGASLVVWAIWEGREAARQIDRELTASAGASVSAH